MATQWISVLCYNEILILILIGGMLLSILMRICLRHHSPRVLKAERIFQNTWFQGREGNVAPPPLELHFVEI